MKDVLIYVILFVITTITIWLFDSNGYRKYDNEMKSHLHNEVIIQQDTLIIINYSIMYDEYTLSDGRIISKHFINELNK